MSSYNIFSQSESLQVGLIPSSILDIPKLFPGSATINGPVCFGAAVNDVPLANSIFGPGYEPGYQISLASIGITHIYGSLNTFAVTNIAGLTNIFGSTIKNALSLKNGVDIANALKLGNGAIVFNGQLTANGAILTTNLTATGNVVGTFGSFVDVSSAVKKFNISHPSKPGYRLIHASLEGPEAGVYYRGHLTNENKITLPDYWENLIDIETITVHLTPHKFHQELYVKSIEWGKIIHIVNNSGGPIDCDYIVYAERKDIEKLKVEIENEN